MEIKIPSVSSLDCSIYYHIIYVYFIGLIVVVFFTKETMKTENI